MLLSLHTIAVRLAKPSWACMTLTRGRDPRPALSICGVTKTSMRSAQVLIC